MQLGAYPSPDEIGVDYVEMVSQVAEPTTYVLLPQAQIPADVTEHPGFAAIGQFGIERHYTVRAGWDTPGFFVGNAADPDETGIFRPPHCSVERRQKEGLTGDDAKGPMKFHPEYQINRCLSSRETPACAVRPGPRCPLARRR